MFRKFFGKPTDKSVAPKERSAIAKAGLWVRKWTRRVFIACAAFLLTFAAAIVFLDDIVRYFINNSTNYIDLNAKVEDVDVHLLTQRIVLKNITVRNPDGFPDNNIFYAAKLSFKFDVFNGSHPLRRIYLQKAKIRIEGRSGKRIMAKSLIRSNAFVTAREIGRVFNIKLERILFGSKMKDFKTPDSSADPYADYLERIKILDALDEIRLENITIENGADNYGFDSLTCHDRIASIMNFKATVFGVKFAIRNAFCDFNKTTAGFRGLGVFNPDGYKAGKLFSIGKFLASLRWEKDANGKKQPTINAINIDSPILRFEDRNGSMLGAIGMDNNFTGLYETVDSMTRLNLGDLFQDEFESVPESQEFALPKFDFDNINIVNARIICSSKDAGFLANKIKIGKNLADIDDLRAHIGGLKIELAGVDIDSEKQTFIAKDFSLKNPAGFPEERAFRFRNFKMSTNFSEKILRGNRVMSINTIEVNNFFVRLDSRTGDLYDLIGNDNNLYALLDSITETSKKMPVYSNAVQKRLNENSSKRPYKYIVNSLKFTGGKILIGPRGDAIKIPFDDVIQTELGVPEKGLTSQETTTRILKEIIIKSIDGAQDRVSEEIGGILLAPIITMLRTLITVF